MALINNIVIIDKALSAIKGLSHLYEKDKVGGLQITNEGGGKLSELQEKIKAFSSNVPGEEQVRIHNQLSRIDGGDEMIYSASQEPEPVKLGLIE